MHELVEARKRKLIRRGVEAACLVAAGTVLAATAATAQTSSTILPPPPIAIKPKPDMRILPAIPNLKLPTGRLLLLGHTGGNYKFLDLDHTFPPQSTSNGTIIRTVELTIFQPGLVFRKSIVSQVVGMVDLNCQTMKFKDIGQNYFDDHARFVTSRSSISDYLPINPESSIGNIANITCSGAQASASRIIMGDDEALKLARTQFRPPVEVPVRPD